MTRFIVAEVSKNWIGGLETTPGTGLVSEQFERVIEVNRLRGYRLHSFDVHRHSWTAMSGQVGLNETIIAVFERELADQGDRADGFA